MKDIISGREVPKDLQGIDGIRTGFKVPNVYHTRLVITGQPGAGKSTFLNSNPHLLSIDAERGGDTVADPQALRWTPPLGTDPLNLDKAYIEFAKKIIQRKRRGKDDIKMVAIDTIDELISIFQRSLCLREGVEDVGDVGGGHGKGYSMARESVFGLLDEFYQAGIGWAIIAHTQVKTVTVGGQERQVSGLAVSDSYKSAIWRKCEHMLFIEKGIEQVRGAKEVKLVKGREVTKEGKTETRRVRKMRTSPGGLWQGGDTNDVKVRVPLPDELILPKVGGWDTFTKAYEDATRVLTSPEGEKNNG